MDLQKDKSSTATEQSSSPRAAHPTRTAEDWEQPDFEELDLCMEVTAYVYHWQ